MTDKQDQHLSISIYRSEYTQLEAIKRQIAGEKGAPQSFAFVIREAQSGILRELALLGAPDVVISTNIELRRDGLPYSKQLRANEDPGVAVYFTLNGEQQCIPCDKWTTIADNMQAIRKTIEALRGLDRWGAKEMVNAAFRGFKAYPKA